MVEPETFTQSVIHSADRICVSPCATHCAEAGEHGAGEVAARQAVQSSAGVAVGAAGHLSAGRGGPGGGRLSWRPEPREGTSLGNCRIPGWQQHHEGSRHRVQGYMRELKWWENMKQREAC